jgi:hypothetical protein
MLLNIYLTSRPPFVLPKPSKYFRQTAQKVACDEVLKLTSTPRHRPLFARFAGNTSTVLAKQKVVSM